MAKGIKKIICKNPWTHFEVNNPNGDVTMCCDNATVLGNVRKQSMLEIWNSAQYQRMRRDMLEKGACDVCSLDCPVLKGFKSYQNLGWYKQLDKALPLYINAEKNEQEIQEGKVVLQSKPRWMRFAYSYVCNLNCYHCYQKKARRENKTLPQEFIEDIYRHSNIYQVIFYFGGEPFLYKPTKYLLKSKDVNQHCQHFFVTNASLLDDEIFDGLQDRNIRLISCSLDAATEDTYKALRRSDVWGKVCENLQRLKELKKKKDFVFTIDMTLNSKNALEVEKFVDLGISLNAEPFIILVSNAFNSIKFQKDYLCFTDPLMKEVFGQIDRSIAKLEKNNFSDALVILRHTRNILDLHRLKNNNLMRFILYKNIYAIYNRLPYSLKITAKKIARNL